MGQARPTNEPSNYIGWGVQPAKDTEATTFFFVKHKDGSGTDIEEDVTSEREGGDGQEAGLAYKTMIKSDGAIVANARPETFGRLLAAVNGADSVASHAVGADHTSTPNATQPYLTVDEFWADEVERSPNSIVTQLDIEFEAGRPLKVTAQLLSGGTPGMRDAASALVPTRETSRPFFYPGASVVASNMGGAKITKGKISVKRQVDDQIQTTSLAREDVVPMAYDVNVDLTCKYEDRDQSGYKNAHFGVGSQLPIDLATGSLSLFMAQGSFSTRLVCPMLQITGHRVNKLDPEGKTMYGDVAAMTIKGATHSFFSVTRTSTPTSYVVANV